MIKNINYLIACVVAYGAIACYSEERPIPEPQDNNSVIDNVNVVETVQEDESTNNDAQTGTMTNCHYDNFYINNCFVSKLICDEGVLKIVIECFPGDGIELWKTLVDPPPQIKKL
jgi:hypothetical protein